MTTATDTATPFTAPAKPQSKSAAVIKLLSRARGATVVEMQTTTNWQPHSVRAYLSGLRKAGRTLGKEERKSGETCYRLIAEATTTPDAAVTANITVENAAVDGAIAETITTAANAEASA